MAEVSEEPDMDQTSDMEKQLDLQDLSPQATKKVPVQMTFNKDRQTGMYKCQMCSYKSMHRSSIKSHYAVHSSLRPYACDQCSYEAKRLNDLRKHKLIKHGKKLVSVRKKYASFDVKKSNGLSSRAQRNTVNANNNDTQPDTNVSDNSQRGHLLYQSLLGGGNQNSNGPVFPQPELANSTSSPEDELLTVTSPNRMRSISAGDIPDDLDKEEGTVVVKPEPPDDYYTFQRELPEHEDPIIIPREDSPPISPNSQVQNLSVSSAAAGSPLAHSPKSPCGNAVSPASSLKSSAQSTSKETGEADSSRFHAASPSVISLLLQRRNLTGSSLLSVGSPASSQPRQLRPAPRSTTFTTTANSSSFYPVDPGNTSGSYEGRLRYNAPQYNPLNLSYNQQQATRSSSESSHSSLHNTPSSSSGRSLGVETTRGWMCDHCNIMFFDSAIYFMHMGLHSTESAWQCNLCGQQLYDVYSFTSHFVNGHVSS